LSLPYSVRGAQLNIASPYAAGYPADAASADLLRRAIALDVLSQTAKALSLARGGQDTSHNAFLYALAARMAARLHLDRVPVAGLLTAATPISSGEMWQWQSSQAGAPAALRAALAVMNYLLLDRPDEAEFKLFRALRSSSDAGA
jgi:hypothetical protein